MPYVSIRVLTSLLCGDMLVHFGERMLPLRGFSV